MQSMQKTSWMWPPVAVRAPAPEDADSASAALNGWAQIKAEQWCWGYHAHTTKIDAERVRQRARQHRSQYSVMYLVGEQGEYCWRTREWWKTERMNSRGKELLGRKRGFIWTGDWQNECTDWLEGLVIQLRIVSPNLPSPFIWHFPRILDIIDDHEWTHSGYVHTHVGQRRRAIFLCLFIFSYLAIITVSIKCHTSSDSGEPYVSVWII